MESCSIPSLSSLPIHHDENDIENKWVLLEDFLLFLRNQHRPTDKIKDIKKSNVQKEFKGHFNGLKEVDGHFRISVRSVLRYCFHHTEQLYICQKVVHQIEKKCFGKNTSSELTIKDIYVRVVKTFYRSEDIENHSLQTLEIDDSQIDTLFNNYKDDFNHFEWKKICLFEHHFGKSNYYHDSDNYEKLVEQKNLRQEIMSISAVNIV
ncbi:unnamed protein product [Mytilus edulis]|uniref:Uncharacterized protein n=1 Tax=Mytilus edulis TaxID=6550 RepID=A0A8S3TJ03_MYTED|nr:unnamed protein product [Mytilus edulis]